MGALNLVFMGTPDFAIPSLEGLIEAGHWIASVYTQPPRPAGRGQNQRLSPVHEFADANEIDVRTPETLRDPAERVEFAALRPEAVVVVAYGLILPPAVLKVPRLGCFNVHASLLPRWRGASPIQSAILAGERETGITIMRMDEGLDTGPIVLQEKVRIAGSTTAKSLHNRLATLGARMMVRALEGVEEGVLTPRPQPNAGVSYAAKLTAERARLDWRRPAEELARQIRALTPLPGAWFEAPAEADQAIGGRNNAGRIKVLEAKIGQTKRCGAPGTVLDDSLTIVCGTGALRLTRVQRAGRAAMPTDALLRGHPIPKGSKLPVPERD